MNTNKLIGFKTQTWGVRWFSFWTRNVFSSYKFLKWHYVLATLLYSSRQSVKPNVNFPDKNDKSDAVFSVLFKQIK